MASESSEKMETKISHGTYGFKGLKDHYEDRTDARFLPGLGHWFGMFDGHGGEHAADFLRDGLGDHVAAALRETVDGFDDALAGARETAKRRKLEAAAAQHAAQPTHGPREKEQLKQIETAAREVDDRMEALRQVSFGSPELAALRERLAGRRAWLDKASRTRRGGRDAADAFAAVDAAAKARADAAREAGAAAAAAACVPVADDAWRPAVERGFLDADATFLREADRRKWDDGSCACACLLLEQQRRLVTANAGDCRLILARGVHATRLTTDHKPDLASEKRRIEKAGGYVVDLNGVWRATSAAGVGFGVDKTKKSLYLAVARSIGDRQLKKPTPVLDARPDVRVVPLEADDLCAVLVCDGICDVLTDQQVVDLALENFGDPAEAAKRIVREAFSKQAADNVTALVVEFPWVDAGRVAAVKKRAAAELAATKAEAKVGEPLDMFA